MDALDLLKSDHDRVSSLYEQFKAETNQRQQETLFETIREELFTHTRVEETVFYPAFKNYPEFSDLLSSAYEDHRAVRDQLNRIELGGEAAVDLKLQVSAVMDDVIEHVRKEESVLFPMVRKLMKRAEREVLGRHIQAAKQDGAAAA